jgi:hypothetical protein
MYLLLHTPLDIKNSRRSINPIILGVPSNFLNGWVGHEPFSKFYKIASTASLHILNAT